MSTGAGPKREPAEPAAAALPLPWPHGSQNENLVLGLDPHLVTLGSHCENLLLGRDLNLVTQAHQDATAGRGQTRQTVPDADGSAESRMSLPGALSHLQQNMLCPTF